MDSSCEFDNIKAEKAKAMRKYQRLQTLETLFHILEFLVPSLLLLSLYSFTSSACLSAATGDFLRRLFHLAARPFSAFLISNGIILIIFALSGKDGRGEGRRRATSRHIYDEYGSDRRKSSSAGGDYSPADRSTSPEEAHLDKQIVPYESPSPAAPAQGKIGTTESESNTPALTVDSAIDTKKDADIPAVPPVHIITKKQHFRRSQSHMTEKPRALAELQRSVTDNGRETTRGSYDHVDDDVELTAATVDGLSNEEFNLRVEKYIAKTKWHLREEIMAENGVLSCRLISK